MKELAAEADTLRELRHELGWTAEWLAIRCGYAGRHSILAMEAGRARVPEALLTWLAETRARLRELPPPSCRQRRRRESTAEPAEPDPVQ